MAFDAKMKLDIVANLTKAMDLTTAATQLKVAPLVNFDEGVGANQANRVWHDTRNLGASAAEDLDLAGAALLDPYGVAVVFARVKFLFIRAAAANVNNVVVGADAGAPWVGLLNAAGTVTLRPGAWFAAASPDATGMVVTATTADLLQVANSAGGTAVDYDIVVIGAAT